MKMALGSLSVVITQCLCSLSKKVRWSLKLKRKREKDVVTMTTSGLSNCNRDVGSFFMHLHQTVMVVCSELPDMRENWDSATTTTLALTQRSEAIDCIFPPQQLPVSCSFWCIMLSTQEWTLTGYLCGPPAVLSRAENTTRPVHQWRKTEEE